MKEKCIELTFFKSTPAACCCWTWIKQDIEAKGLQNQNKELKAAKSQEVLCEIITTSRCVANIKTLSATSENSKLKQCMLIKAMQLKSTESVENKLELKCCTDEGGMTKVVLRHRPQ